MPEGANGAGSTDQSIASMREAAANQEKLMVASTQVSAQIQAASSTAQTIQGANAAGGEVAKTVGRDIRESARAS